MNGPRELYSKYCDVSGITSAFLGEEPAIVLHAEDSPASATMQEGSASAAGQKGFATSHLVAWPLGAPESFRRHVEFDRLQGKAAQDYVPYVKAIGLYQLKDFAIQPLHEDVVAVVWGKPYTSAQRGNTCKINRRMQQLLSDKGVPLMNGILLGNTVSGHGLFPHSRVHACADPSDTKHNFKAHELLLLQEDASEFLLRKALVQVVVTKEKNVKELLYHPAALRAAGICEHHKL
ncbi:hypothetical protein ACSSS7_002654 [Eimeria intestinalis]